PLHGTGSLNPCLKDSQVLGTHPRGLKFTTSELSASWQPLSLGHEPWDLSVQVGTGHASQRPPPGMRHKTRCGETPPHCDDPAPPSHLRLLICQTHSLYPGGSGAGPAWPWATGAFPGYLPAANSLRSCQQVKQIWGCHCLYSGSHSSLARGPQTGSIHWGTGRPWWN
uniref:Uncharacterized protein n=1 Tax=Sus scrofa TaxID=9823 RepID=A0A8D0IGC7_PIG